MGLELPAADVHFGYRYRRAAGAVYQMPVLPASSTVAATTLTLNVERAQPFVVSKPGGLLISSVLFHVQTAVTSAVLRMGLRATDPTTGMPGNLLTEFTSAGAVAAATVGAKTVTPPANYTIPEGLVWLTIVGQTAAPALAAVTAQHPAISRFAFDGASTAAGAYTSGATVTGALPSAAPAWSAVAPSPLVGLTLA